MENTLQIIEYFRAKSGKETYKRKFVRCKCFCGKEFCTQEKHITSGNTTSCGCKRKRTLKSMLTKHGECVNGNSPELSVYYGMRKRCLDKNCVAFPNYGGRGIEMKYSSYEEFVNDVGRRPSINHTIDRINVDGHYEVGNCRWVTRQAQNLNKRNTPKIEIDGVVESVHYWCLKYNIPKYQYYNRKKRGCSLNEIFNRDTL